MFNNLFLLNQQKKPNKNAEVYLLKTKLSEDPFPSHLVNEKTYEQSLKTSNLFTIESYNVNAYLKNKKNKNQLKFFMGLFRCKNLQIMQISNIVFLFFDLHQHKQKNSNKKEFSYKTFV